MAQLGQPPLKQIEHNWILITYDIPEDESAFRRKIIRRLQALGAQRHTQSVYYMPFSKGALATAQQVQQKGLIFVWYQHLPRDEDAGYLTQQYVLDFIAGVDNLEHKIRQLEEEFSNLRRRIIESRLKGLRFQHRGLLKTAGTLLTPVGMNRMAQLEQRLEKLRGSLKKRRRKKDDEASGRPRH